METGLEYFSLLSNVCNVLESHVGSGDKVLAEFITDLGRNCEAVDEFESKPKEFGAGDFPDYLVRSLLTTIHAILPSTLKTSNKSSEKAFPDEQPSAFPALSLPDDRRDRARELRLEIEIDAEHKAEDESRKSDRDRDWDEGNKWR